MYYSLLYHKAIKTKRRFILSNSIVKTASQKAGGLLEKKVKIFEKLPHPMIG